MYQVRNTENLLIQLFGENFEFLKSGFLIDKVNIWMPESMIIFESLHSGKYGGQNPKKWREKLRFWHGTF
jgi:hypothetical protein